MTIPEPGKVFLVGAGPGDPDLLTVRAARLIREASCILHDDLVPQEILCLSRPGALVCNVGKRCGQKYIEQREIHRLMLEHAKAEHMVVRLKSGDPVVYGRAGEEIDALQEAGIPFEIVPGITAASAAAAAAGLSLTDRRRASRVLFTTGHHAQPGLDPYPRYSPGTTVACYMPGRDYGSTRAALIENGWPVDTKCVIVSSAGRRDRQMRCIPVQDLAAAEPLPAPAILLLLAEA